MLRPPVCSLIVGICGMATGVAWQGVYVQPDMVRCSQGLPEPCWGWMDAMGMRCVLRVGL